MDYGAMITARMDVRRELEMLADEPYRIFHSRLLPGVEHILGVRIPKLWKLARLLAAEDGAGYLERASDDTYEEILLQGMVLCLLKEPLDVALKRLPAYMAKIDNWAECDVVCSGFKKIRKDQAQGLAFLKPYLHSEKEFEVRFAVVLLLDYYVDEAHIRETLELLSGVSHPGYYVKMAVAWALSVCYVKFPEATLPYLQNGIFDEETYHKAIQKIVESNRVSPEAKAHMKQLRKEEKGRRDRDEQ
ncbi:MAG: DNA alkylation repair protein [Clostridium sp.]|nr:DNA alkylation repair protein [Clostridium sp.]MDY5485092.1 DNA alkylation repair protein [Clostridium sp.]